MPTRPNCRRAAGARQGAELPLRGGGDPPAATRTDRDETSANDVVERHAPRLAVPRDLRGRDRARRRDLPVGDFEPTPWMLRAEIIVQDESPVGCSAVYYLEEARRTTRALSSRRSKLINTPRRPHRPLHPPPRGLRGATAEDGAAREPTPKPPRLAVALDLLRSTDRDTVPAHRAQDAQPPLLARRRGGAADPAAGLRHHAGDAAEGEEEEQRRRRRGCSERPLLLARAPFELAAAHLSDEEILAASRSGCRRTRSSA